MKIPGNVRPKLCFCFPHPLTILEAGEIYTGTPLEAGRPPFPPEIYTGRHPPNTLDSYAPRGG